MPLLGTHDPMASARPYYTGLWSEEATKESVRREREFLRYAEAVHGITDWEDGQSAHSSKDVTLTAFAQLVCLRLNAQRTLITLFDKGLQYFIAEATRTLSLQQDDIHEPGDALFWGSTVVKHQKGLCAQALHVDQQPEEFVIAGAAVCYPDLRLIERYADHKHVIGAPYAKSFIGVPLLSPSGCPIGSISVIDDRTRWNMPTPIEVKYMQDVATSVIEHLELKRTQAIYARGLKMVKGLSRFMEGEFGEADDNNSRKSTSPVAEEPNGFDVAPSSPPKPDEVPDMVAKSLPLFPSRPLAPIRKYSGGVMPTGRRGSRVEFLSPEHIAVQPAPIETRLPSPPDPAAEDNGSGDIGQAFQRAADIIQHSMDMAGVVFLGASPGGLGGLKGPANVTSGSEGGASTTAGSDDARSRKQRTQQEVRLCKHLAAAYDPTLQELPPFIEKGITEQFLKSLMRHFPYGKIWNFSDDELLSSDEHSDSNSGADRVNGADCAPKGANLKKSTHKRSNRDHEKILEMFPGVRSFGIMPMWDSQRQRFFAGAIVWSYSTSRVFSMGDEIRYLGAFCDVIMAEISKMDVQADVRAKLTFISSVSHELRSPLHGILGAVECLQENSDELSSGGGQMLQIIDTCGRSLLDIINNLLDRAEVKPGKRLPGEIKKRKRRNGLRCLPQQNVSNLAVLTEEVLDSALWLTPEPAPQSQARKSQSIVHYSKEPLKIAFDINPNVVDQSQWNFHIDAGAWRRIVQNLVSNAIKYTDKGGYCKVTLSMSENHLGEDGCPMTLVELSCADSGRGMSRDYLAHGLWQEFQQEESNVQGTGLGLSLVRSLIEDMDGTIDVRSIKWVGTTIKISIPLQRAHPDAVASLPPIAGTESLSFGLRGFDTGVRQDRREIEAIAVLRSSVIKMCQSMGMKYIDTTTDNEAQPNLWICPEHYALSTGGIDNELDSMPFIILCNSFSSSRAFSSTRPNRPASATMLSQPLGPHKLRKAILEILTITPTTNNVNGQSKSRSPSRRPVETVVRLPSFSKTPCSSPAALLPQRPNGTFSPPAIVLPAEMPAPSPSPSVLLVDDNPVNLSLLQRSMDKIGRKHVSATNGLEAVEAYQNSLPITKINDPQTQCAADAPSSSPIRIIFMDITMPVMDGLESTQRIRAHERSLKLKPAKIAALTALASPQARQDAYASGIDLFLTKPVRFREISEILKGWGEG